MHFKNNCWLAKITQVHISSKNGVYHLQKLIAQGLPTSTSQDNNSYRWWRMQFYEVPFSYLPTFGSSLDFTIALQPLLHRTCVKT